MPINRGGNPVARLQYDHANMARVLTLIREQLERLARQAPLDYTLLANGLYYMRKYPSVVHHPKEDLVFQKLLQLGVPLQEEIAQLLRQHEEIYVLEDQLIELALAAQAARRHSDNSGLVKLGRRYLSAQFEHMQTEELSIFPVAARRLKPGDWRRIRVQFDHIDDPLFGPKLGERYRHLYDYLLRSAAADELPTPNPVYRTPQGSTTPADRRSAARSHKLGKQDD